MSVRGLELKSRLQKVYSTVKEKIFVSMELRIDELRMFYALKSLLSKTDHKTEQLLITEISNIISCLLKRNKNLFKVWETKFTMENTRVLLEQFKDKQLIREHVDNPEFYAFVKAIEQKASQMDDLDEVKQITEVILKGETEKWSVRQYAANFAVALISISIVLILAFIDEDTLQFIIQTYFQK